MTSSGSNGPILAADIGGTKVSIGVAVGVRDAPMVRDIRTYESRRYDGFETLLAEDLASREPRPAHAAFAIAGPIRHGTARVTNLPWTIDRASLRRGFGFTDVLLLNDVEALAWVVPSLAEADLSTLQRGEHDPAGAIAVIAPGTGLGEAFLTRSTDGYSAHPSEGGHADFAPRNALETRLLTHLQDAFGHASWERVASGSGLANVHRFLVEREGRVEVPPVAERLATAGDAAPVIIAAALDKESPVCVEAVRIFAGALAAEAGNLALKVLATGGAFLGGGLPPRVLPFLNEASFVETFRAKGRFSELLARIPIHVIGDPHAVLRGAAIRGARGSGIRGDAT